MKTNQKDLAESLFETYNNLNEVDKRNAEKLFPGLFKSEDEKIIEECIGAVNIAFADGDVKRKCIDYLEKQKESLHVQETCKENADSFTVEPENEKTRQEILHYFNVESLASEDEEEKEILKKWIAYLERQKEHTEEGDFARGYDCGYECCLHSHGAEWLEKQKKQKPAEKQDYSGLTDFQRAIHRGFLCAGVENVPRAIIEETAQDCINTFRLTQGWKPAWSEED